METTTPKKAIAQISADASLLISEISRKEPGEVVEWGQLKELVGWDIQQKPSVMGTVKNRLLRDYGLVLSSVMGVGYRILKHDEVIGELASDRQRRRRAAVKSKRKASTVDLSQLDETQRVQCLGEIAVAHITAESSGDKAVARIESKLDGTSTAPLSLNHALEAIKKNL